MIRAMRKLLALLLIVSSFSAAATPIKSKIKKGMWSDNSTWDLTRSPNPGDTVIIKAYDTVLVDRNLSVSNIHIQVQGALQFTGGGAKLVLDAVSTVEVMAGGTISSDKNASQIISIGGALKYPGNGVVISGPAIANSATTGFLIPVVLPVKYLGFSAVRKSTDVFVQWATSQESGADYYEVGRSEDGSNWKAIGRVSATGTSNNTSNYSYTDKNASSKTVYYRIKQVDLNGRFEYTTVRIVKADGNNIVDATAVRGNIVLQFAKQVQGQVEVRLVSFNGTVVSRQQINRPVGQLIIPATVKGNYILTVSDQQDIQVNKQILL